MVAETEDNYNDRMVFEVEKAYLDKGDVKYSNTFGDYKITNVNFGIARVPVSTVDLQKHVDEFEIVDSAGINTIAKLKLQEDNTYKVDSGEVLAPGVNQPIDVSIENEKLQGARLRIKYVITAKIDIEKNFDGKEVVNPTFTGILDFIDNNLEYNKTLGDNDKYWKLISYDKMKQDYIELKRDVDNFTPKSTVTINNNNEDDENKHKVIIEATEYNPLLDLKGGEGSATLVLEKVLSSNDSAIELDSQDMFTYANTLEIKGFNYATINKNSNDSNNTGGGTGSTDDHPLRDRIRTIDGYIIIPGGDRDTAVSEVVVIHPPTGDGGSIGITYYIVGLASLCILAIGVFGIKRFIIKR